MAHQSAILCLLCLVCSLAALRALGADEPLYDQVPYDQLTLDAENDHAVLKVKPLALPADKVLGKGRRGEKIVVQLLDQPNKEYEVQWRSIEKIETFAEVVLAKAKELSAAGQFDEAYDFYRVLQARYPNLPGLQAGIEDFLFAEATSLVRAEKFDRALALLYELQRRNPQRAGLDNTLAQASEKRVERYVAAGNVPAARRLIRNLAAAYPKQPTVARWEQRWRDEAGKLLIDARSALAAGEARKADQAARRLVSVWPALPGARELLETVHEKYARVIVGVSAPATSHDPGRLNDWAARRTSRLIYRTLTEFVGPSPEGGQYVCPVGRMRREEFGRRLVFQLTPGQRWASGDALLTGYELARRLVAMTDVRDPWYRPQWAEVLDGASVDAVYTVTVDLRRPHVRPESLLATVLVPAIAAGQRPPPGNGPYVVGAQDDTQVTYLSSGQYQAFGARQPKEIVERFFRKGIDGIAALKRRQIDVLDRIYPWDVDKLRADEELVVEPYAVPLVHCLVPNHRQPLTGNRTFCRALVYGLQREAILERLMGGSDQPGCLVVSGPFSPGVGYNDPLDYAYDKSITPRPYEPRLAAALAGVALREVAQKNGNQPASDNSPPKSGENGPQASSEPKKDQHASDDKPPPATFPRLVLAYPPNDIAEAACKAIKRQLELVGIPILLEELPPTPPARIPDHVDLMYAELAMWEPVVDAGRLLGDEGIAGGCSSYMSLALGQLEQAEDWLKVGVKLRDIHRIAHDDAAVVPLWQLTDHFAYHRSLKGVGSRPVTLYQNIEQWQPALYYPSE